MYRPILLGFPKMLATGLVAFAALACGGSRIETVVVKGSDTEVNLVQELAERYMETDPDISLTITGGGSGFGIASLINRRTHIANSSRPLNGKEEQLVAKQGIRLTQVIFAQDAIAVVVHPATGIRELTIEQIGRIYRGEIRNWNELGGNSGQISLYGRQSNSGTFVYFRERVVGGEYDLSVRQMNGTAQIIEAVKQDAGGIGYVGVGYLLNEVDRETAEIVAVSLRNEAGEAVAPTDRAAIIDGRYPIVRPLYQFLDGRPGEKTLAFLRYELSAEGQRIIRSSGYFEINEDQRRLNSALGFGL